MKFGVSSYSFSKYIAATGCDYKTICDKAKQIGFDGIEFIPLEHERFNITKDPIACAKEIRAHCEKIGLEIVAYTVGGNLTTAEDREAEVRRLMGCVDVCAELGAKTMRHDVGFALPKDPLYGWQRAIKDIAPYIRRVTEYAASRGIRTCVENHGHIFQAPERVEALIREVNHPNYGWLVDIGNFLCADVDPKHAVSIAAPYAFHVHAKDFLFKDGQSAFCPTGFFGTAGGNFLRGTVIGHGIVPVASCVRILKKHGYSGWLSLEFEGAEVVEYALENGLDSLKKIDAIT